MRQHKHRAMLDCELEKGAFDLVAIPEAGDVVTWVRSIDHIDRDLETTPSRTARVIGAGVDEKSVEPGIEPLTVAKAAEVPPGPDEGVLHGILRGIPIAEDPSRDRVQPVVCGRREVIEGLVIASLCTFDEFGRQRRPLGADAVVCRVHRVWRRRVPDSFIEDMIMTADHAGRTTIGRW
jgi:hypothetical protein